MSRLSAAADLLDVVYPRVELGAVVRYAEELPEQDQMAALMLSVGMCRALISVLHDNGYDMDATMLKLRKMAANSLGEDA